MKTLFIITSLICSPLAMADSKTKAPTTAALDAPVAAPANEVQVGVNGMVCAFCAQGIEKNFKAHKEVESITVSLENKFVKIKFKPGQTLDNKTIADILKNAGYEANFGG